MLSYALRSPSSVSRPCETICQRQQHRPLRSLLIASPHIKAPSWLCRAKGLGDELLDFVTAGPKLRKWYGQGELPSDGGFDPEDYPPPEEEEEEEIKDAILVTDAESPTGEQVLLQLILSRATIKAVVSDVAKAKTSYGPYVTPISLDIGDKRVMQKALKGVRAVVVSGRLGSITQAAKEAGVQQLVLISSAGLQPSQSFSLGSLFGSSDGVLSEPAREQAVLSSGVPCTVIKAANIKDTPGGSSSLAFLKEADVGKPAGQGFISRQDVALVAVKALEQPVQDKLIFQVIATGPGAPPADWESSFSTVMSIPTASSSSV